MTAGKVVLEGATVDSSAIMSILDRRDSSQAFIQAMKNTSPLYMDAPTLVELSVVVLGKKAEAGLKPLDDLLRALGIEVVAFDASMVARSRAACMAYGKGHSPANLNMGDLYSYGLAMDMHLPLFFEGLDFCQTNVQDAMQMLGYAFDAQHQPLSISDFLAPSSTLPTPKF